MAANTVQLRSVPSSRDQVATLVGRTMALVACTAGFFAAGAYAGRDLSYGWSWVWFLPAFGLLIAMNYATKRSATLAIAMLFGFGLLVGFAFGPTLSYYASSDPSAVWEAGAATALFIAAFGAAGYAIRRDLSSMVRYLLWALVALLVFGVVAIFVQIPGGALIYAIVGLVIFAGFTIFDFQRLRLSKDISDAPLLAASIFLDVLNVFLFFLTIFSGERD